MTETVDVRVNTEAVDCPIEWYHDLIHHEFIKHSLAQDNLCGEFYAMYQKVVEFITIHPENVAYNITQFFFKMNTETADDELWMTIKPGYSPKSKLLFEHNIADLKGVLFIPRLLVSTTKGDYGWKKSRLITVDCKITNPIIPLHPKIETSIKW